MKNDKLTAGWNTLLKRFQSLIDIVFITEDIMLTPDSLSGVLQISAFPLVNLKIWSTPDFTFLYHILEIWSTPDLEIFKGKS